MKRPGELLPWDNWQPKHHGTEAGIRDRSPYRSVEVVPDPTSTKGYFTVEVNVGDQLFEEWLYCRN